ncbi:hypothetical protein [Marinactinospora rubrisoli]|uniref:Uncharacterized protein n=1 Tax=Marinactinospora rubrisoli TaxID=2715399 RepID=A0ABW2KNL2_9ACTN
MYAIIPGQRDAGHDHDYDDALEGEDAGHWPDGLSRREVQRLIWEAQKAGTAGGARPDRDPEYQALIEHLHAGTGRPRDPYTCDFTSEQVEARRAAHRLVLVGRAA